MKKLRIAVLGITQAGKTTAIIHLAKNYKELNCLCYDEDDGRTKISVRYHLRKDNIKDSFKLVKLNENDEEQTIDEKNCSEFAKKINSENCVKQYDHAEVYLVPNDDICKMLSDNSIEEIVLYDTRGLMDIMTEIDNDKNEKKITDLTKIGIDKPDGVLFFYAKEGSSNIKTIYKDLIEKTFSSAPFFVFFRAEEHDKKKYNNLLQAIVNFFEKICIKLNISVKTNNLKFNVNVEYNNSINVGANVNVKSESKENINPVIPFFNTEEDVIYRLSEYDLNTHEDEDKYTNEMNDYIYKIVKHILSYNQAMINKELLTYLENEELQNEIINFAMNDIKKYKGNPTRKTKYCYPEKEQHVDYETLLKCYKENEILGPYNGIATRDGKLIYFYTIVLCTLIYNVIYVVFNNSTKDEKLKSLLRTALLKATDTFYCNSFLFDRFVIAESIKKFRQTDMKDDLNLFKIVVKDAIDMVKTQIANIDV